MVETSWEGTNLYGYLNNSDGRESKFTLWAEMLDGKE